jgi:hypothetical protein
MEEELRRTEGLHEDMPSISYCSWIGRNEQARYRYYLYNLLLATAAALRN